MHRSLICSPITPRQWLITALLCLLGALSLVLGRDAKILYQIVGVLGLIGGCGLLVIRQRRLALILAWILIYPLSLEKVFPFGAPPHPHFLPYFLVVSGADVIAGILGLWLLIEARLTGESLRRFWPKALTPFLLLIIWVVIAFLIDGPSVNGFLQIIHWSKMLLIMMVLTFSIRSRDEYITVLAVLALAVFFQSALVGISYATGSQLSVHGASATEFNFSNGETTINRASGTLGHSNQQAAFQLFFTLPLLGLLAARNYWWRIAGVVVILSSLVALLLTFSRGAWVSGVAAAIVIVFVGTAKGRMNRQIWLGLTGISLITLLGLVFLFEPISERLTKGDAGASASRLRMVAMAIQDVVQSPLTGVGPGNFIEAQLRREPLNWLAKRWVEPGQEMPRIEISSIEYTPREWKGQNYIVPLEAHNKLLLVMAELGCLGLGLFLWYLWRVMATAWACLKSPDPILWWSGLGLTGAAVSSPVLAMVELFYDDKSMLFILFFNVLAMALFRIVRAEEDVWQQALSMTGPMTGPLSGQTTGIIR